MLELATEYFMPDLKQLIEQVLTYNIQIETFEDTLNLTKAFECKELHGDLMKYAKKNYLDLYRKGALKGLTRKEYAVIKPNYD